MRASSLLFLACLTALPAAWADGTAAPDPAHALEAYVKKAQPAYGWHQVSESELDAGVKLVELKLTSQTWGGRDWEHTFDVLLPPPAEGDRARPGHALLVIAGDAKQKLLKMVAPLAAHIGVPVAILFDVPNQPLFQDATPDGKGLREDAAIAHTFVTYMKTGDPEQLLILPMVRSAVSAMNALGEFSRQQQAADPAWPFGVLDRFVTTGASKRGWTTWLTGVVEPQRVLGIAPIVYDNLNIQAQIKQQLHVWGAPSHSIHDYTDAGLLTLLQQPRAKDLCRIVDPFSYANRLQLPKLQLIGTNDSYWPLDAINIYRGSLPGDLYCHYVPNAGHHAGISVVWAISGFFDAVTGRIPPLPEVALSLRPGQKEAEITLTGHEGALSRIKGARLWGTRADTRDFRGSQWVSSPAQHDSLGWHAGLPAATVGGAGHAAYLGEVEFFDSNGASFLWHSPVQVWEIGPQQK